MNNLKLYFLSFLFFPLISIAQSRILHGHLFNKNGKPISGASIYILGGDRYDNTTTDGEYILNLEIGDGKNHKSGDQIDVYISHPKFGIQKQTIPILNSGNQDITIKNDNKVVITGTIVDKESQEPVKGLKVSIKSEELTKSEIYNSLTAITDEFGSFSFILKKDEVGDINFPRVEILPDTSNCYKFYHDLVDIRSHVIINLENSCHSQVKIENFVTEGNLKSQSLPNIEKFTVIFGSVGVLFSIEDLRGGVPLNGMIGCGKFHPIELKMIEGKPYISGKFYDIDGKLVGEINNNKWTLGRDLFKFNYDETAIEVIDAYGIVVLQVIIEQSTIIFHGVIHCDDIMIICADGFEPLGKDLNTKKAVEEDLGISWKDYYLQQARKIKQIFDYSGNNWLGKRKN
ncbi:MAG: hypothetical protein GC192_07860 [Bacteroidetes bacterium]|nr:hypothetical protein [Bacteroidota bacterium]